MKKLKMKARAGVTLVELLVVILIITILSVSLLPLLKPYIEQSKYAAEVQSTLANIQTKINLYQYEKDKLPCWQPSGTGSTDEQTGDYSTASTWWVTAGSGLGGNAPTYEKAYQTNITGTPTAPSVGASDGKHLSDYIDVDWQDLSGRRMTPAHFSYYLIKGGGAIQYGYAIGAFGNGDGLAKGTGYAILVLVDTKSKLKVIATWERYKPVDGANDTQVMFKAESAITPSKADAYCHIPSMGAFSGKSSINDWTPILTALKQSGWSFSVEDSLQ
jgi:prepilin-type N-terminal cleavage/methylation domain-containing protein